MKIGLQRIGIILMNKTMLSVSVYNDYIQKPNRLSFHALAIGNRLMEGSLYGGR
jgi:hypothetical protein